MSSDDIVIAGRFRAALEQAVRTGDHEAVLELLDPGFEWWDRADDPGATVTRGHNGYLKRLAELDADIVEMRVEVKETIDAEDYVAAAVRVHGRGRASGAPFEEHEVHLLRFRDGKATEMREYRSMAEALEAAVLSE